MYLLKFLQKTQDRSAGVNVEYRLACSGEFYNRKVLTSDWRKSDVTRILLDRPFPISVASQPFDSYPQELCVRVTLNTVTEQGGAPSMRGSRTFLPDNDVIEDLCSILSLLSRRLVSPVTKTREIYDDAYAARWHQSEMPMPILHRSKVAAWPRRPATIITSWAGQTFKSNDPPPVGVDPDALAEFLLHLPGLPNAQDIVHAARLYRSALEFIVDRPDTAYLMLVSVVESLASVAFKNYEPGEAEKLQNCHLALQNCARDMGLNEAQIKALTLAACKQEHWLRRKFIKFCVDYCPAAEIKSQDRVFVILEHLNPPEGELKKAVSRIYDARSGNLHTGDPFPPGVGIGTSPQIKIRDLPLDPVGRPEIPPVPWFERIVSIAARKFLIPSGSAPFVDCVDE